MAARLLLLLTFGLGACLVVEDAAPLTWGASEREAAIRAEIAALGPHPWAGVYRQGDLFDRRLRLALAPRGGAFFSWEGCTGRSDENQGAVVERDGVLHLAFERPNVLGAFGGCPDALVIVPWGERVYLLAEDEFPTFAARVNAGIEPRDHRFGFGFGLGFLREAGAEAHAPGWPRFPVARRALLLAEPIEATLTGVLSSEVPEGVASLRMTRVALNVGAAQGVYPELLFFAEEHLAHETYEVVEVAQTSCVAEVEGLPEDPRPQPGRRLSTRRPD